LEISPTVGWIPNTKFKNSSAPFLAIPSHFSKEEKGRRGIPWRNSAIMPKMFTSLFAGASTPMACCPKARKSSGVGTGTPNPTWLEFVCGLNIAVDAAAVVRDAVVAQAGPPKHTAAVVVPP
jgi:hypothetical protein